MMVPQGYAAFAALTSLHAGLAHGHLFGQCRAAMTPLRAIMAMSIEPKAPVAAIPGCWATKLGCES